MEGASVGCQKVCQGRKEEGVNIVNCLHKTALHIFCVFFGFFRLFADMSYGAENHFVCMLLSFCETINR